MKGKIGLFSNIFLGCHNNTGKRTKLMMLMKISFIDKLKYKHFYQLGAYKGSAMLITGSIVFLIKMKRIRKVYKEVKMCLNL